MYVDDDSFVLLPPVVPSYTEPRPATGAHAMRRQQQTATGPGAERLRNGLVGAGGGLPRQVDEAAGGQ